MKVKDISKALGGLIDLANQQASAGGHSAGPNVYGTPEDSIPSELLDEPIFDLDYKSELEQCIDKARKSIMIIVRDVVPEMMLKTELIKDKIELDAELLGNLYYQYVKKETYHQALMDLIARGDHSAKAFEVCEKISRSLEELGSKVTELLNQLRKYYIDTYLDLQHKDTEDEINLAKERNNNYLEEPTVLHIDNYKASGIKLENRMVGTESVTKSLAEAKRERLKALAQALANS